MEDSGRQGRDAISHRTFVIGPGPLNRAPTGSEPARRRQLERDLVAKGIGGLQHTLPEAGCPDDNGPVVILECAGQEFGRAGGAMIHQQRNPQVVPIARWAGEIDLGVIGRASPGDRDGVAGVEEQAGDAHPFIDETTRIAPEIQHQRRHSIRDKTVYRLTELRSCAIADPAELDIPDPGPKQNTLGGGRHVDDRAGKPAHDWERGSARAHHQGDERPAASGECFFEAPGRPAAGALPVDAQDLVAWRNGGASAAELWIPADIHLGPGHLALVLPVTLPRQELCVGVTE